uniref:(northern house mosquito) hypothetical protein n=1 Tax=Culex pipiens TaxID=7175 RepID=A0A8D8EVG5_CULPI
MRFHRKKGPCERRCFRVCRASPFCRFYQYVFQNNRSEMLAGLATHTFVFHAVMEHNMSVASQDFSISVTNWIPKQLPVHSWLRPAQGVSLFHGEKLHLIRSELLDREQQTRRTS